MENEKIGFIGAGKVGVTLGSYFLNKGRCVAGYISRSPQSALTAAEKTSTRVFSSAAELVEECGIVFITTPDDQIENVWNELIKHNLKGHVICHTSGSLSSKVFSGIKGYGAAGYSVHPMYAFADRSGRTGGLEEACFAIEGDSDRLDEVKNFFSSLGNSIIVIDSSAKALYHLANVIVSNLVLALLNIGCECMSQCGVDMEHALKALMPLITHNIANISQRGFESSLTGPVERNDTGTMLKHLNVLPHRYGHVYADLSLKLVELARRKHPARDYTKLQSCLESYMGSLS